MADYHQNKKKKKSFMSMAKKNGKMGVYGKGVELTEDEYIFFMNFTENLKNSGSEYRTASFKSFFRMFTEEDGPRFVCNQIVSRMLEKLLPEASVESLLQIQDILGKDLWAICTDTFASHVLETVLILSTKLLQKSITQQDSDDNEEDTKVSVTEEHKETIIKFIIKVSKYCSNNLHDFITETYASHTVRKLLEILSGVRLPENSRNKGKRSLHSFALPSSVVNCNDEDMPLPEDLTNLLPMIADRLRHVPDLPNIITTECGSAVYQAALQVLQQNHYEDLCLPLVTHLLTHGIAQLPECQPEYDDYTNNEYNADPNQDDNTKSEQSDVPPVFQYNATARLLEFIVNTTKDGEQLQSIYSSYFKGKMEALALHKTANFAVQRLLDAWTDKETLSELTDPLSESMTPILVADHSGVVLAWAKACGRLKKQQGEFCATLCKAIDCTETTAGHRCQAAECLVYLMTSSQYKATSPDSLKVSLHGALILQQILNYRKPIKFVESLLDMDTSQLVNLMCDPRGSHITDAFCNSNSVGGKNKFKLVFKVQGMAVTLATSKHGSRSLESLMLVSKLSSKSVICQHLTDSTARVLNNEFGRILYKKFSVRLFTKADKTEWEKDQTEKVNKKRKLQLLLQEGCMAALEGSSKKKKRKAEDEESD